MFQGPIYKFLIAGVAMCASVGASAATITYDYALDGDGVATSPVSGVNVVNFNNGCGYVSCTGNFDIETGSVPNSYTAPQLPAGGPNNTPFLKAPETTFAESTSSTYTLGTTANYFGLLWGSIDEFNTISFLDNGRIVSRFTGGRVARANPDLAVNDSAYVNFFDLPMFDSIRLTSSFTAFESDNHAFGAVNRNDVPEPGSLLMFAAGLLGIGGFARRRGLI